MNKKIIAIASTIFFVISVVLIVLYKPVKNIPNIPVTLEIPSPTNLPKYIPKKSEEFPVGDVAEQSKKDIEFQKAMDRYEKENPLLQLMPVLEPAFHIEYQGKGIYKVTLFGENKQKSKLDSDNWWRSHSVDPGKVNLIYIENI